ncbi:glycosyltransferase family 2 protein [Dactylosporangium sp. NPDC005555]|uniref:glycosyltransferase family 2 protein n=1 Tax=Dactylosporangium sp. NPDC005555 TaxID=3154889 RepID=UPI0033A8DEF2
MLAFLLQINAFVKSGAVYPFAVFMLWVWLLWLLRVTLAGQYRPVQAAYNVSTSVVIPVVDEPEDLFREVLSRIREQRPTEIIVVINGPRNEILEKICSDVGVRWVWTETPGKRNAVAVGVGMSSGDVVVLVDSDTVWTNDTLRELVKPFRDPRVGGVTTRQRILDPGRTVLTRWADWLENVRNEYSMPAMSVLGTVGCLPGRTIAFRRSILVDCMDRFLTERFLGVFLEVSDDRTLTNYTLQAGYRTVYQSTSLVFTDAPTKLAKLTKQQYRWARGSQYNTLRMLPWMLRNAPVLAVLYLSDILVPFVLVGCFVSWGIALATGLKSQLYGALMLPDESWQRVAIILGLTVVMTLASLALRFGRHFAHRPGDVFALPVFMLINTFILMPIRVLGFFRMAHNAGWGTRAGGFAGERRRNPMLVLPYIAGVIMLCGSVLLGA